MTKTVIPFSRSASVILEISGNVTSMLLLSTLMTASLAFVSFTAFTILSFTVLGSLNSYPLDPYEFITKLLTFTFSLPFPLKTSP
ncbi:hypothetical protein [Clostridium autoethanogenum]|uniref:Uncharacterized protein n=1 Tax=Clostridium autoethanogenum DSM 10061 TaxID=1341692 RepID=A0ABY4TR74_9CLOT|nr:hypothetical protein [Clostridium autoethanogenum]URS74440.1 hypothetical protein CAETHG_04855 [Clostridium autoethanogenum DSM 10061]